MTHRKDNIVKAYEFLKTEFLDGDYRITDSEGHPLPFCEITALWDDKKIAKKFGVGQTTINYLRKELNIPSSRQRKRIIEAMFDGKCCKTAQKSPVETEEPKNTLPSWCEEGRWVIDNYGIVGRVTKVDGEILHVFAPIAQDRFSSNHRLLKPIRFREYYTFEEAKELIGKCVTAENDRAILVRLVESVKFIKKFSTVLINNTDFAAWKSDNATIDGVPIGVPVIDEEALKEGAE